MAAAGRVRRRRERGAGGRAFTLTALGIVGLLWVRLLVVQPRAQDMDAPADLDQKRIAARKLTEVNGTIGRLARASRKGEARAAVLRLSAGDINALLVAEPEVRGALEEARIHDPRVELQEGQVVTTATVERAGLPFTLTAQGRLAAHGGALIYASDSVRVRGVPAPAAIRDAVDARIQAAFRQLEEKAGARVDHVTVGSGQITLRLTSAPE